MAVFLRRTNQKNIHHTKSLSGLLGIWRRRDVCISDKNSCAKALPCTRLCGSFTVEAVLAVPLFLFAAAVVLGIFSLLQIQIQVTGGLQYVSRSLAASCREAEADPAQGLSLAAGKVMLGKYLREHDCRVEVIEGGTAGISLLDSDFSGDYVTLRAVYRVNLPISFWGIRRLRVSQCVSSRKWTGADERNGSGLDAADYVYVTPSGTAYHADAACPYLDLSIHRVADERLKDLRNRSGGIYYRCSCWQPGAPVYVTDYGDRYHGDLNCPGLKRTVYRVRLEEAAGRHPCTKCYGGS